MLRLPRGRKPRNPEVSLLSIGCCRAHHFSMTDDLVTLRPLNLASTSKRREGSDLHSVWLHDPGTHGPLHLTSSLETTA